LDRLYDGAVLLYSFDESDMMAVTRCVFSMIESPILTVWTSVLVDLYWSSGGDGESVTTAVEARIECSELEPVVRVEGVALDVDGGDASAAADVMARPEIVPATVVKLI
jgi:hypothetical protein